LSSYASVWFDAQKMRTKRLRTRFVVRHWYKHPLQTREAWLAKWHFGMERWSC
jgi:hypothetical protein